MPRPKGEVTKAEKAEMIFRFYNYEKIPEIALKMQRSVSSVSKYVNEYLKGKPKSKPPEYFLLESKMNFKDFK